jgi:Rrf2 family protein
MDVRLELTRSSDLAIRALTEVAGRREPVKLAELATLVGTTPAFLAKLARPLLARGWLESTPGPRGGYSPGHLGEASVLDVIEAVEGPTETGKCVLRGGPCGGVDTCSLHHPWTEARSALMTALAGKAAVEAMERQGDRR